jgi:ketosteroid isomerase-like protein
MTSAVVRTQVEAVNRRFYEAFESLNMDALADCWASTDQVACVHPGGPWVTGWDDVRDSWDVILANTGYIEVAVEVVAVVVNDPVAWVSCIEHVTTAVGGDQVMASVAATNVFVLGTQGWRLVLHHASPVVRLAADA